MIYMKEEKAVEVLGKMYRGYMIFQGILLAIAFAMLLGCGDKASFQTTDASKKTTDLNAVPGQLAWSNNPDYTGHKYSQWVVCYNSKDQQTSIASMIASNGGWRESDVNSGLTSVILDKSGGASCNATETSQVAIDPTTRTMTFTGIQVQTSTSGTCVRTYDLAVGNGGAALNTAVLTRTYTHNQVIGSRTRKYVRFMVAQLSGPAVDTGYAVEEPSIQVAGDSDSKCYIYYK